MGNCSGDVSEGKGMGGWGRERLKKEKRGDGRVVVRDPRQMMPTAMPFKVKEIAQDTKINPTKDTSPPLPPKEIESRDQKQLRPPDANQFISPPHPVVQGHDHSFAGQNDHDNNNGYQIHVTPCSPTKKTDANNKPILGILDAENKQKVQQPNKANNSITIDVTNNKKKSTMTYEVPSSPLIARRVIPARVQDSNLFEDPAPPLTLAPKPVPPLDEPPPRRPSPLPLQSAIPSTKTAAGISNSIIIQNNANTGAQYITESRVLPELQWSSIYRQLTQSYVDPLFRNNKQALVGQGMYKDEEQRRRLETMQGYEFKKRLKNLLPNQKVYNETPNAKDVLQGGLGNCYFLSSLAALADNPDRVTRLIIQHEANNKGIYCIALNITGLWKEFIIDDYIPTDKNGNLVFCQDNDGVIWPILFEKAYAKAFGAYCRLDTGGTTSLTLRDLTGAPAICYHLGEENDDQTNTVDTHTLLELIEEANGRRFIITSGTDGEGEVKAENGLTLGHAYTFVQLLKVRVQGQLEKLVHLRNPWGKDDWNGEWSESWQGWTQQLRNQIKYQAGDDTNFSNTTTGEILMTFDDFCDNFKTVSICYYHDGYSYSAYPTRVRSPDWDIISLTVLSSGEYYIGCSQRDARLYHDYVDYKYGYVQCVMFRVDGQKREIVCAFAEKGREAWKKVEIEVGQYELWTSVDWAYEEAKDDYTAWVYGPATVNLASRPRPKSDPITTIVNCIRDKAIAIPRSDWTCISSNPALKNAWSYYFKEGPFCCYVFENQQSNLSAKVTSTMSNYSNCSLVFPLDRAKYTSAQFDLNYQDVRMVMFKYTDIPCRVQIANNYSMSYTK